MRPSPRVLGPLGVMLVLPLLLGSAAGFRVLGLFQFSGHSHNIFFKALMEALAERGHQVTVLSSWPQKAPKTNYTDVDLSGVLPSRADALTYDGVTRPAAANVVGLLNIINNCSGNHACRLVFESQQFKDIMAGVYGEFDIVATEIFGSDCMAAVAHKLKLPLIGLVSNPDIPWMHSRLGSIDNPSYIGVVFGNYIFGMNFLQRAHNVFNWFMANYLHKTKMEDGSDELVREYLGADTPSLSEIVKNTSLVLVNRHVSINTARPVSPNVLHVGGLHVRKSATISKMDPELRSWMDAADHGVIFFSLGSLVRSSSLPQTTRRELLDAFASLPQRVLWKFEDDISDLPANVRIAKWLPQSSVLAHPKLLLFMTHGGLMGTLEALIAGVPMLGIPLFADQMTNIQLYQTLGIAERLDHWNLNRQAVTKAIRRLIESDMYRRRAREVAATYADRPLTAEEEAVWWVEYVVRHRGAPHLRPLGADLPLYQYLLLDVAAAALAAAALFLLTACSFLGMLCRQPRCKKTLIVDSQTKLNHKISRKFD